MSEPASSWDATYSGAAEDQLSWYQAAPTASLELLDALHVLPTHSVLDVGGGTSRLVDELLDRGFEDVAVLDVSALALDRARRRLGPQAAAVTWIHTDLLTWTPPRTYDVWHDRAVFHFLTAPADQQRYRQCLRSALAAGGHGVVGAFAADGPTHCSGLPVVRYTDQDLIDALGEEGLAVLGTRRELHKTPSGATQPFTWVALERL